MPYRLRLSELTGGSFPRLCRTRTAVVLSPLLTLFAVVPSLLAAQTGHLPGRGVAEPVATVTAVRASGQVRIDGRLDDEAWRAAAPIDDFTQSSPEPGATPSQRTEARVLYDDRYFYVAVRAHDTAPDSIAAPLARRDGTELQTDWIHVIVDSRMDRSTAFRFSVNPRGVQRDVYTFDDGNEDGGWDAIWEVGTSVDSGGWSAEFRIPLSQLRFGGSDEDVRTWGFQIMRDIARTGKRVSWAPWSPNDTGFVESEGLLRSRSPAPITSTWKIRRVPAFSAQPRSVGERPVAGPSV